MKLSMESVVTIICAAFVIMTAMIDPKASFVVALVAIVLVLAYIMLFSKNEPVSKVVSSKPKKSKPLAKSKRKK